MAQTPVRATGAWATPRAPGLQLYGIVSIDPGHDLPTTAGAYVVPFRDLGALVADAAYERSEATPEAVRQFHSIVDGAFGHRVIVPAPFGTRFQSRDTLLRWLELHYFTLMDALTFVEDRVMARVLVCEHLPGDGASAAGTPVDLRAVSAETFRLLRRHAVASLMVTPSRESSGRSIGASFLVDRDKWGLFEDVLREERARHTEVRVESSGPWPPYDFVTMQFGG